MAEKDLRALFVHQLKDTYFAENAILKALPQMAEAAQSEELRGALAIHLRETEGQVKRLEQVFQLLGEDVKGVDCEAMDGILDEAKSVISDCDDPEVCDAAMLSAAQAVEHYEMTRYGTLIAFARQLGKQNVVQALNENLEEEKAADRKLTSIAESRVNRQAA